jgi:hypothetical protein
VDGQPTPDLDAFLAAILLPLSSTYLRGEAGGAEDEKEDAGLQSCRLKSVQPSVSQ